MSEWILGQYMDSTYCVWLIVVDKIVHISITVHAVTKPFKPMCSPCDGDYQKKIVAC